MLKIAALAVLLVAAGGHLLDDYCNICADHTMCIYEDTGPKCAPLLASGINAEVSKQIVELHNYYRSRIASGNETYGTNGPQPPAANMRRMEWDPELAKIAQRWANQCDFKRDMCRNVRRFEVGQNAFILGSSASDTTVSWKKVVESWYDEVRSFNSSHVYAADHPSKTRHYTQLVWAKTNKVGCGFAKFKDDLWYRHLHVCNYGPGGNILGEVMYQKGVGCSQCPLDTNLCRKKLCTS